MAPSYSLIQSVEQNSSAYYAMLIQSDKLTVSSKFQFPQTPAGHHPNSA